MRDQTSFPRAAGRSLGVGAVLLGIALGGLFDGILLHQVLQWHHLLSLLDSPSVQDIRVQILADGVFHVLMYAIACVGLWLIWSACRSAAHDSPRRVLALTVLGFGGWQFADVILFHWIMRIHRIRVDVPDPLLWDIGWMIVFGLPALAIGYWLLRRSRHDPPGRGAVRTTSAGLTAVVLLAAFASAQPSSSTTLAVFSPGTDPAEAFAAAAASGARIMWADRSGTVLALHLDESATRAPLWRSGAILVRAMFAPCAGWVRG